MANEKLYKECVKLREQLVVGLKGSRFAADIKSDIDRFAEFTADFIKEMAPRPAYASAFITKNAADEQHGNISLQQFKSAMTAMIAILKTEEIPVFYGNEQYRYKKVDVKDLRDLLNDAQDALGEYIGYAAEVKKSRISGSGLGKT
jgi:hypothetical protein